jgi:hypothetical protein
MGNAGGQPEDWFCRKGWGMAKGEVFSIWVGEPADGQDNDGGEGAELVPVDGQ